ncbi:hypothetical protein I4641_16270 [Waterburya agarophytonicola K14]|uniref:Pentraxin (PTX) domain-containing protein n=1 Tax=Waterburya agarophytonicola KI4 TaxID=2874699 RepID=A0A964BUT6_9CYAN|nr:hypothetical protein [Waterburya agarophytonicola]MCC0178532.1 hypothetical protein [Waterburya agarophytonicola KI4]
MEKHEDCNSEDLLNHDSFMILTSQLASARISPTKLKALVLKSGFTIESWIKPNGGINSLDIFGCASSRGRYQLSLDAIGSVFFDGRKPRKWMMVENFVDFPVTELTLEFLICPFRGNSQTTLVSYVTDRSDANCEFAVKEDGCHGLTITIGDQHLASGINMDYSQWQRIAITWESKTGQIEIYKDDGSKVIAVEGKNDGTIVPFGSPVFVGTLAPNTQLASGGFLVFGQGQTRPGDVLGFPMPEGFVGGFSEVRLWRCILNQTTLNTLKGCWLTGDEPGLVGCWRFTGLALSTGECRNICQTGNDGVLGGFRSDLGVKDILGYRVLGVAGQLAYLSTAVVPAGKWCHLTMVVPEGSLNTANPQLFINSQQVITSQVDSQDISLLEIGQGGIGSCGDSELDALKLWNIPLSETALKHNYLHHYPLDAKGLFALYDGAGIKGEKIYNRLSQDLDLVIKGSLKAIPSTSPIAKSQT